MTIDSNKYIHNGLKCRGALPHTIQEKETNDRFAITALHFVRHKTNIPYKITKKAKQIWQNTLS